MPNSSSNMDSLPLSFSSKTVKYLVFLFNLIFFISGFALIITGAVAQGFFREYVQFLDNDYKTPAIGIIILGVIILFISFFGCCGAKKENICMLRTFAFLLGFLLLCEVAAAITVAVLKTDIRDGMEKTMLETMNQYKNDSLVKAAWDDMQKNLKCCGTHNYTDWRNTTFGNETNVPDSCCIHFADNCGVDALTKTDTLFKEGCSLSLKDAAISNLGSIVGVAVALGIVQIIGILMSLCLVHSLKECYEQL